LLHGNNDFTEEEMAWLAEQMPRFVTVKGKEQAVQEGQKRTRAQIFQDELAAEFGKTFKYRNPSTAKGKAVPAKYRGLTFSENEWSSMGHVSKSLHQRWMVSEGFPETLCMAHKAQRPKGPRGKGRPSRRSKHYRRLTIIRLRFYV
jgi:hypothetical protein